jgi:hypothetical protein
MTDPNDELTEDDAAARRDEVIKRMLATPPQPRPSKKGREPKPAPKTKG